MLAELALGPLQAASFAIWLPIGHQELAFTVAAIIAMAPAGAGGDLRAARSGGLTTAPTAGRSGPVSARHHDALSRRTLSRGIASRLAGRAAPAGGRLDRGRGELYDLQARGRGGRRW
jgi:hypothetical protein